MLLLTPCQILGILPAWTPEALGVAVYLCDNLVYTLTEHIDYSMHYFYNTTRALQDFVRNTQEEGIIDLRFWNVWYSYSDAVLRWTIADLMSNLGRRHMYWTHQGKRLNVQGLISMKYEYIHISYLDLWDVFIIGNDFCMKLMKRNSEVTLYKEF